MVWRCYLIYDVEVLLILNAWSCIMFSQFKLVTNPVTGKKSSTFHYIMTCLIEENSPLIQSWNISHSKKESRDVYYIEMTPPSAPVLTLLPEGTRVTCHLSIDECFVETGAVAQRRNQSICHYTEQYDFPINHLWRDYQQVTIHAYANRNGDILDEPKLKGFKPDSMQSEYITFPSALLKNKIDQRARANAKFIQPFLKVIIKEKIRRYSEVISPLNALEEKLAIAFKQGKRTHKYDNYLKLAHDYRETIRNINLLNDEVYDPRGDQISQFCDLLKKAKQSESVMVCETAPEALLCQNNVLETDVTDPEQLKKAHAERNAAEQAALCAEYKRLADDLEPKIEEAKKLLAKSGRMNIEEGIALSLLRTDLELGSMTLCIFMERKYTHNLGGGLTRQLDDILSQIEKEPPLTKLFITALRNCDLNAIKQLYSNMLDTNVSSILASQLLVLCHNTESNLYLNVQKFIEILDFLFDNSLNLRSSLHILENLVPYNQDASIGTSVLGSLMVFRNKALFEYLLSKGMDANGTGCIYQKNIYSLCETAIALQVPTEYLHALLTHGASLYISRLAILPADSVESRIMLRQYERIAKCPIKTRFSLLDKSKESHSKFLTPFDVLAKEQQRSDSLIKLLIYCNQNSSLARVLIQSMSDSDMGKLSLTELLLLLAILNISEIVNSRFLPSCTATTLAVCTGDTAANLMTSTIYSPKQYTGRVSYLFYPTNPSSADADMYVASYKKIERALVQHLQPENTQLQVETSRNLRSLIDTHSQKRPKLAFTAITATIYSKILTYDGRARFFHGLDQIFDDLSTISSRPEVGATGSHCTIFKTHANQLRELYQQGEINPTGDRFRFYQAPPSSASLESTSFVEELSDGLEM